MVRSSVVGLTVLGVLALLAFSCGSDSDSCRGAECAASGGMGGLAGADGGGTTSEGGGGDVHGDGGTGDVDSGGAPGSGPGGGAGEASSAAGAGAESAGGAAGEAGAAGAPHCDTLLRGHVLAPSGTFPIYNAAVYVPTTELQPMVDGTPVGRCPLTLSGSPAGTALTEADGSFELTARLPPSATEVRVVAEIGKWRREITVPIEACGENELSDVLLPSRRSQDGHLPKIALTTGGGDTLECLLRKIGIDDSEFTPSTGDGRVHLYGGAGGTSKFDIPLGSENFAAANTLWSSATALGSYDLVVLSCEGAQHPETKPQSALDAVAAYLAEGGRVFGSHWHNYWIEKGPPPMPTVANFNFATDLGNVNATIATSFPKGVAFAAWLADRVGTPGSLKIIGAKHTVDSVNAGAQSWVSTSAAMGASSVQMFSFNTPVGAAVANQRGRYIHTDMHTNNGDTVAPFPRGCTSSTLTPEELASAFAWFDLSTCILPDGEAPVAPAPN
jgi:hypothetical protein